MELIFQYESEGLPKTLVQQVKETNLTFNFSVLQSWGTIAEPTWLDWQELNGVKYITQRRRSVGAEIEPYTKFIFLPTSVNTALAPLADWTDTTYQMVLQSGMDNFVGDVFKSNSYKVVHCGEGMVNINFGLTTIHEGETDIPAYVNSGIAGLNPTQYPEGGMIPQTLIQASSSEGYGVLNDNYSRRPNLMFLHVTIHDDVVSSETYGEDFDVIAVLRSEYDVTPPTCYSKICFIDKRLFGESEPMPEKPTKSTAKGNTPNGFRGGRDDHSDSDTVSTIGTGLDTAFVNTGTHGVKLYRIDASSSGVGVPSQYDDLYNCFWSENFWDKYRNAKWSPLSGVISLHMMPCDPTDAKGRPATFTTNQQIYIAGQELSYVYEPGPPVVEIHAHGDVPDHSKAQIFTKTFHPLEYTHSFLDWGANTRARLRLPFIGVVPVEISKIMEGGLFAKYNIDFLTGNCLVQVYTVPSKDVMGEEGDWDEDYGGCVCLIAEYSGNCAQKLNFAGNDYGGNYAAGYVGGIASTALSQEHEGVENFVNHMGYSIIGGYLDYRIRSKHHIYNIPATANVSTMGMMIPALIIDRPIDITPLDENGNATVFESFNGRPAASGGTVKDYKSLDTGEGIFIKGILHADTLYATEDEKRQIESAFAKGVYI